MHRRNCVGCHIIEGDGGDFVKLVAEPSLGPPMLTPEGARVQPDWLYAFLRGPIPIRPWLNVRMPTFGLDDANLNGVIDYFGAIVEHHRAVPDARGRAPDGGRRRSGKALFELLKCQQCHVLGAIPKDQPTANLAPDLRMAPDRLQPDWILQWLKNPAVILPGTRMPAFWPDYPKSPYPAAGRQRGGADSRDPQPPADAQGRTDASQGRRLGRRSPRTRHGGSGRQGRREGTTVLPAPCPSCPLPCYNPSHDPPAPRPPASRSSDSVFIDDSAQVIGDVEIGEESSVWMCVVIRGDVNWIRIGRRTNIQDGTIVHVHDGDASDDHRRQRDDRPRRDRPRLHDRGPVPDRDGRDPAERRRTSAPESIVAAGTLLVEGMQVPPRSLVMGSPGKVKRTLTDDEVAGIQGYADRYVGYRLDYIEQ